MSQDKLHKLAESLDDLHDGSPDVGWRTGLEVEPFYDIIDGESRLSANVRIYCPAEQCKCSFDLDISTLLGEEIIHCKECGINFRARKMDTECLWKPSEGEVKNNDQAK